jgi:DNA (cytosine-5)-methyltransferase 1
VTQPTAIDLFAGAGGASLGLVQAGFDLLLAVELEEAASRTHRAHLPGTMAQVDVRQIDDAMLAAQVSAGGSELDVLFAGPPCQGFSIIGARALTDLRNTLFLEVLRATRLLRPRAVVIENVPGILTMAEGAYLRSILQGLEDLGYSAACAELLAAHYGAPQMRWRVVIIAWRKDQGIEAGFGFPAPTHGNTAIGDLVSNATVPPESYKGFLDTFAAIGDLPPVSAGETVDSYNSLPVHAYQLSARTTLDSLLMDPAILHDHYAPALAPQTLTRIRALKPGQDWRDLPLELLPASMRRALRKDHTRRYRRMTWDGVPRTIITRFRDPKTGEYTHPAQDRTISIREAARIQGFPDWFSFAGTNTSKYEQIGNAVPVPLARAVAEEVGRCLAGTPGADRVFQPFRRRPVPLIGAHGELQLMRSAA